MATVISHTDVEKHNVNKYNFKILALGSENEKNENFQKTPLVKEEFTEVNHPDRRKNDVDSSSLSKSSKDSLIESLMQKTDEMSSNFIKLQTRLEAKEEEFAKEIVAIKEKSFNEGVEVGLKKAKEEFESNRIGGLAQYSSSVTSLENSAKEFESALESIKSELITAALDIAKEVIDIEISKNSSSIAKSLGDSLIQELQNASKITMKVNPKDHGSISEHVGALDHIQILSDSAVSEGGVVVVSDAGNIDSQISKRFERVKKAVLSE